MGAASSDGGNEGAGRIAGAVAGRCDGLAAAERIIGLDSSAWTDGATVLATAKAGAAAGASAIDDFRSSSLLMLLNRLAIRLFGTLSRVPKYLFTCERQLRHKLYISATKFWNNKKWHGTLSPMGM